MTFVSKIGDVDHGKLASTYGYGDTLKTVLFLKDQQILEERVKNVYPKFKLLEAIPLASGAFSLSSKLGTIYELKIVKECNVDSSKIK